MSNWFVTIINGKRKTVIFLEDTFGPENDWKCLEHGALDPSSGKFTNQTNNIVPTHNYWIIRGMDIDSKTASEYSGIGEVFYNDGSFPAGAFDWFAKPA